MLALLIIVVGAVTAGIGARCAGEPGGLAVDRSGTLQTAQPAVRGTARSPLGWLGGQILQIVGYVLVMFGFMLLL